MLLIRLFSLEYESNQRCGRLWKYLSQKHSAHFDGSSRRHYIIQKSLGEVVLARSVTQCFEIFSDGAAMIYYKASRSVFHTSSERERLEYFHLPGA
ncbi:hypothetical protein CEXT_814041 [Caerostris extrusa]|uniref:Uncharacterized protein n=1 Tax=Caerostris extrusa TaxID=172846 RepID=A0AAV4NLQ3_CAEEX|nr:hypothetical protein CEXT_814041 [Caerostris extrusa]